MVSIVRWENCVGNAQSLRFQTDSPSFHSSFGVNFRRGSLCDGRAPNAFSGTMSSTTECKIFGHFSLFSGMTSSSRAATLCNNLHFFTKSQHKMTRAALTYVTPLWPLKAFVQSVKNLIIFTSASCPSIV